MLGIMLPGMRNKPVQLMLLIGMILGRMLLLLMEMLW